MERLFLDTNVLLEDIDHFSHANFLISSVSLVELENIKTNRHKTEEVKAAARKATRWLADNHDKYDVIFYCDAVEKKLCELELDYTEPDMQICGCVWASTVIYNEDMIKFVTHDLSCRNIAEKIFGLSVEWFEDKNEDNYTGFIEVAMSDEDMAYFYEHQNENRYGLLVNQYLIIKNQNSEVVDSYRWDGEKFQPTKIGNIKSDLFGIVKPYKGDVYQQCLLNSLANNKITMVKGKAGTGKSFCAFGYLCYLLEKHKIDKIIMFTNTQPTINTARLGFYPGSRDEKLLESSVGNILASKLGDNYIVERMIAEGKLILLPMCDIRGYSTSNMNAGIWITEAQNLDIQLMKLALQRIGEDSICVIDGDYNAQVDSEQYAGKNNGMRRLSEVFRNHSFYGEIELQNIYRSKIAELAEQM